MMIDAFKDDYFWMLREGKGYFPWLSGNSYQLARHLGWNHHRKCPMCHDEFPPRGLVKTMIEEEVCENPLLDLTMKALIRAEIRLISRFIPQRSHEERLTGNLVSEIDSAVFLIREAFRDAAIRMYSAEKHVDFIYYDLSRGGTIEKDTGADLGFVVVVDLPDQPLTVKSLILQAKKLSGSAKIERSQYEALMKRDEGSCAYLFYDMEMGRRCSPLVVPVGRYNLKNGYEECQKSGKKSFSIAFDKVRSDGYPLSLFLASLVPYGDTFGKQHGSFKEAFQMFNALCQPSMNRGESSPISDFNGRLGVLSIGKQIKTTTDQDGLLELDL
jgi:hypothetical protein